MEVVPRATFGEMTSARARREAGPPDLIVWANAKDWHKKVECLLSEHLTSTVKRRLRTSDPDRFYSDDLQWLEEACGDDPLGCCIDEVLADLLFGFRVRTYHACRPRNALEYLNLGLRCLQAEEARSELRRLVYRHDRLACLRDEAVFAAALARVEMECRTERVFVGLDDRDLLEGAGHYLIYGSEYLLAVLVQAGDCYFQDVLKLEVTPTVTAPQLALSPPPSNPALCVESYSYPTPLLVEHRPVSPSRGASASRSAMRYRTPVPVGHVPDCWTVGRYGSVRIAPKVPAAGVARGQRVM